MRSIQGSVYKYKLDRDITQITMKAREDIKGSETDPNNNIVKVNVPKAININTQCRGKDVRSSFKTLPTKGSFASEVSPPSRQNDQMMEGGTRKYNKRLLKPKCILAVRKKFKEDDLDSERSGYDADISDSSLKLEDFKSPYDDLIDTTSEKESNQESIKKNSSMNNENIKKLWEGIARTDRKRGEIKFLTIDYIEYIGEKLNLLFYKFIITPSLNDNREQHKKTEKSILNHPKMVEIFTLKAMCDLIEDYYWFLNKPLEHKTAFIKSIYKLFKLLEKDFQKIHKTEPWFTKIA